MAYRYRCGTCQTTWPTVSTHDEAIEQRSNHRANGHDGGIPDEESIEECEDESSGINPLVALGGLAVIGWLFGSKSGKSGGKR